MLAYDSCSSPSQMWETIQMCVAVNDSETCAVAQRLIAGNLTGTKQRNSQRRQSNIQRSSR